MILKLSEANASTKNKKGKIIMKKLRIMGSPKKNGKTATALLITCTGQVENNTNLVQEFFHMAFDGESGGRFHMKLAGRYVVPYSDSPDFMERAKKTADTMSNELERATK
jgi:hypothetical protein